MSPSNSRTSINFRRGTRKTVVDIRPVETQRSRAVTGSDDGRLVLWDLDASRFKRVYDFRLRLITAVDVDWAQMRALIGHGDADLDLYDLEEASLLRSFPGHSCLVSTMCVSWTKGLALCGSGEGALILWDVRKGGQARSIEGHGGGVTTAAVHWSSMRALTGAADCCVRLWNLRQGQGAACLRLFTAHQDPIRSLSVDWDAGVAITSSGAVNGILVWRLSEMAGKPTALLLQSTEHEAISACTGVICLKPKPWPVAVETIATT